MDGPSTAPTTPAARSVTWSPLATSASSVNLAALSPVLPAALTLVPDPVTAGTVRPVSRASGSAATARSACSTCSAQSSLQLTTRPRETCAPARTSVPNSCRVVIAADCCVILETVSNSVSTESSCAAPARDSRRKSSVTCRPRASSCVTTLVESSRRGSHR